MSRREIGTSVAMPAVLVLGLVFAGCAHHGDHADHADHHANKVPVTTVSNEARELYLEGRTLQENLRRVDAREKLLRAVEHDPEFAMGHLLLANTSATGTEFFESLGRAVEVADGASEGERHMILAASAGANSKPAEQLEHLKQAAELHADDERVHNALGGLYFGRQQNDDAIQHLQRATEINPDFAPAYNMLGYSYRRAKQYNEAEEAFLTYVKLIPGEPNPYDSYAEFLMKTGRFDESIKQYRKALEVAPDFIASLIGIANNEIFLGRGEDARSTLKQLAQRARDEGEQRQAMLWTAVSHMHEGNFRLAQEVLDKRAMVAEESGDLSTLSGDLNLIGTMLVERGDAKGALERFKNAVAVIDEADVPEATKQATHRNFLFAAARVALVEEDLEAAKTHAAEYNKQVAELQVPFEVRQTHELAGMIALAEGDNATAATELVQGNQQNPRVLHLLALAYAGAEEPERAHEYCTMAANFNGLNVNYAYVRAEAQEMLASR